MSYYWETLSRIIMVARWDEQDWTDMPGPHHWEHVISQDGLVVDSWNFSDKNSVNWPTKHEGSMTEMICRYRWYAEIRHCFMGSNMKTTEERHWRFSEMIENNNKSWYFSKMFDGIRCRKKSPEHVAHHQMNSFRSLIAMNWRDPDSAGLMEIDTENVCIPLSRILR